MNLRARLALSVSTCALTLAPALVPAVRPPQAPEPGDPVRPERVLEDMAWLAGSWSGDMWGGRFEAYYSTPEGGKILGHSRLMRAGSEAFYEFEVFEAQELIVRLQPFPGGSRADGLQLRTLESEARKAVFENPEKDFPTRIVYHRVSEDELVITLSDLHGSSGKTERFELHR